MRPILCNHCFKVSNTSKVDVHTEADRDARAGPSAKCDSLEKPKESNS